LIFHPITNINYFIVALIHFFNPFSPLFSDRETENTLAEKEEEKINNIEEEERRAELLLPEV